MSRRTAIALLFLSIGLTACGVSAAEHDAHQVADDEVPFALLDADAPALIPRAAGATATICLVDGDKVAAVARVLAGNPTPTDLVRSLADDVTEAEANQGYRTALIDSNAQNVVVRAGIAHVELTKLPQTAGQEPTLAVAQIVCTLTNQPGIGLVSFSVAGATIQVPRADGSLAESPVSRDDYAALTEA